MEQQKKYNLVDKQIQNNYVIIIDINVSIEKKKKLEQIGIYKDQKIKILESNINDLVFFEINNVKYALRDNELKNIIVKKE